MRILGKNFNRYSKQIKWPLEHIHALRPIFILGFHSPFSPNKAFRSKSDMSFICCSKQSIHAQWNPLIFFISSFNLSFYVLTIGTVFGFTTMTSFFFQNNGGLTGLLRDFALFLKLSRRALILGSFLSYTITDYYKGLAFLQVNPSLRLVYHLLISLSLSFFSSAVLRWDIFQS